MEDVSSQQIMHTSSLLRMKWFADTYMKKDTRANVLDVGSYNVNGCYRDLFPRDKFDYIGLDMEPGPNVDFVPAFPYNWREIADDSFDAVISGQALEHIEFFWITMGEITRVTKQGGLICIVAPNGFGEHRYPVDCWRFFADGMVALARYTNLQIIHAHTNSAPQACDSEWFSHDCADSMLIARKPYAGPPQFVNVNSYNCKAADLKQLRQDFVTHDEAILKNAERNDAILDHEPKHQNLPEKDAKSNWAKRIRRTTNKLAQIRAWGK